MNMKIQLFSLLSFGSLVSAFAASTQDFEFSFKQLSSTETKLYLDGIATQSSGLTPFLVTVANNTTMSLTFLVQNLIQELGEDVLADQERVTRALQKSIFLRGLFMSTAGVVLPVAIGAAAGFAHGCGCVALPVFFLSSALLPIPLSFAGMYWGASVGEYNKKVEMTMQTKVLSNATLMPGESYQGLIFVRSHKLKKARTRVAAFRA